MSLYRLFKIYEIEIIGALAAVGVYCAMYAFRKPFTMLSFDGLAYLGIHYKVWLVSAQLFGHLDQE